MKHGGERDGSAISHDFSVNLNPLGMPEGLRKSLICGMDGVEEYPDYDQTKMRKAIADLEGVSPEEVLGGNGASELLLGIVHAISPKKVLLVRPCFMGYDHVLQALEDCEILTYETKADHHFILQQDFLSAITPEVDLCILTSPNNPNGACIAPSLMEGIVSRAEQMHCKLLVDETFFPLSLGGESFIPHIKNHNHVIVLRALTKTLAIPGLRVGYMLACPEWIGRVQRKLPEWNMSSLAQLACVEGAKILTTTDYGKRTLECMVEERKDFLEVLERLGFSTFPSDTIYVLARHPRGQEIFEQLKERGILVRSCKSITGLDGTYLRFAIKKKECQKFLVEALEEIVDGLKK